MPSAIELCRQLSFDYEYSPSSVFKMVLGYRGKLDAIWTRRPAACLLGISWLQSARRMGLDSWAFILARHGYFFGFSISLDGRGFVQTTSQNNELQKLGADLYANQIFIVAHYFDHRSWLIFFGEALVANLHIFA
jgi:hypothetical protein